jgi:hypothetical protein
MTGARVFVAIAFVVLGASFLVSSGLLLWEFRDVAASTLLVAHSHLFVFFPIFGVLVLIAFYLPCVVFTDLYWHRLGYGKLRFLGGLGVVLLVSWGVYLWLDAPPRQLWEVSPRALLADAGEPSGCQSAESACRRAPLLATLGQLREAARTRIGLVKFARSCVVDKMLEPQEDADKERFCFPALRQLRGAACCEVQRRYADAVAQLQADRSQRSLSGTYDPVFLFLKIFFVLIIITLGPLLARWRGMIDRHYRALVPAIERGMIVGGLAMLFWPVMDYGYQETNDALFGRTNAGPQLRLSLVIAPWVLLMLFYFLRRLGKQGELIGRVAGIITAGVAVLRSEELNDWAVRVLGIGTEPWIVAMLAVTAACGLIALWIPWNAARAPAPVTPAPS